jgi:hypothetical protein
MTALYSTHNGNAYKTTAFKPEDKRPLRRPRCRWEDYIQVDFKEI